MIKDNHLRNLKLLPKLAQIRFLNLFFNQPN
jgi:hypothetical protein